MEPQNQHSQSIVDELRRRKVLRSTTIYAVCGWCLLQWSDFLFSRMGWPDWSIKLVLAVVVLGFPVTVALAWAFDISPAGIRRTDPGQLLPPGRTKIALVVDVTVVALLLATVLMLVEQA